MKLRIVTILATGLMMIGTAIPFVIVIIHNFLPNGKFIDHFAAPVALWLFTSWPLIVSLIIAENHLKYIVPVVTLLVSMGTYCLLHFSAFYLIWLLQYPYGTIVFGTVSIWSLPVMVPIWIVVLRLNSYYAEKIRFQSGNCTP